MTKISLPTVWNLSPLYKSDQDPRMDQDLKKVEQATKKFIDKWQPRTDYLKDPKVLKTALDEFELWNRSFGTSGKLGFYIWLRTQQDQNDPKLKAQDNKIDEFSTKLQNEIQFFTIRLSKVSPVTQKKFLSSPLLKDYRHFLEKLFLEAKHLLSEPEEKIMNLKSAPAYNNWVKMTSAFLAKETRPTLTEGGKVEPKGETELLSLISSQNKQVRDSAAKAFNQILDQFKEIAENEVNSILQNKKINDDLRGYPRPDTSRHQSDDIETEVVDSLVEAVSAKFDLSARYYQLKAKLLGQSKLEYHERNVEYGEVTQKYSYEQAYELVMKTFTQLDPEFAQIFESFAKEGTIDVYPKSGKRGGAFCAYWLISQPTYILLNHTDRLNDVLTLAHELGHGINDELIKKAQNALNFGTPISTAEVASTFMEDFVLQEILKKADDQTRLAILMMKLNDDVSSIFRQVACYKFETELHQKFREVGYLSSDQIGQIFQKNMSAYMGPGVVQSPGSQNWWVYWSHIRSFFYVYSYASGLLISKSLQASVKLDPEYIGKVKQFLSSGLSDSPKNIFSGLGIDITDKKFWQKGLNEIEQTLEETEKLAKRLKKLT